MKYVFEEPPRPSERINQFRIEHANDFANQVTSREDVLAKAAALAIEYPDGCEASSEVPTTEPGRVNRFDVAFRHDPEHSYQVTAQARWAIGSAREVTWTFDSELPLPIRDAAILPEIPEGHYLWNDLRSTLNGLVEALAAQKVTA